MINNIIKLIPASFDLKPEDFIKYKPKKKSEAKSKTTKYTGELFSWDEDDCVKDTNDYWARYYGYD